MIKTRFDSQEEAMVWTAAVAGRAGRDGCNAQTATEFADEVLVAYRQRRPTEEELEEKRRKRYAARTESAVVSP